MSNASSNESNPHIGGDSDSAKEASSEGGCCGGSAPKGSGACCLKDARAKQNGAAGCGCKTRASAGESGCC